jgi:hypothetical protein
MPAWQVHAVLNPHKLLQIIDLQTFSSFRWFEPSIGHHFPTGFLIHFDP